MQELNLIIVGDDVTDENVLAVLAALQAFEQSAVEKNNGWNKVHRDNRVLDFKTYLICPFRYEFIFRTCLSTLEGIYSDVDKIPKMNWTYVCHITIVRAMALALNTDKPLALAIGILLGCESSTLASVENLCQEYSIVYDVITDIQLGYLPIGPDQWYSPTLATLEDKISIVFSSKAVIGYSSFETYLACCLNKPVLEIQKDPSLYKWTNKHYSCITDDTDKDLLSKGITKWLALMDINA